MNENELSAALNLIDKMASNYPKGSAEQWAVGVIRELIERYLPTLQMGRCVECVAYIDNRCANTGYYKSEFGFCDDFEPKGGE